MADQRPTEQFPSFNKWLITIAGISLSQFMKLSESEKEAYRAAYEAEKAQWVPTLNPEPQEPEVPSGYGTPNPGSPGGFTPPPYSGGSGDPWSTGVPWRPSEPTGGLYGGFSGLAGGQETDYERLLGDAAMDFFKSPVNFLGDFAAGQDENNLNLFRDFMGGGMNGQENSIWSALSGLMGGPSQNMNNVLGNWQWMASGLPTGAESDLFSTLTQGLFGGPIGTGATGYETDVLGRYKDFSGKDAFGYELDALDAIKNLGNPNAYQDEAGRTASVLGSRNMSGLEDYSQRVYGEMTGGAANPFELGSWNTASDLSSGALSNPEQIALAGYQGLATPGLNADEQAMNAAFKKYGQEAGRAENAAFDTYKDMDQGYSDAEKEAIATSGMKAAREGFGQARDQMARRAAATGQNAGYYGAISDLSSKEAEAMGGQARKNTMDFANEAQRRKEVKGQGMTGLANVEQRRGEFGLTGQQQGAQLALQRQLGGLGGIQSVGKSVDDRRLGGANLQRGVAGDITSRRMGATGGMMNVQGAMNDRMAQGGNLQRGLGQDVFTGRQAKASGLQGWGNDFTDRQLRGTELTDRWNQTQFGQRGQTQDRMSQFLQGLRDTQLAGTQGAQGWENQLVQQILGAAGQGQGLNEGIRGNQRWGAEQASNWMNDMWGRGSQAWDRANQYAQQGRDRQKTGLGGLMDLYNQNDPMSALGMLGGILSKPREVYSEGGEGGFDVGDL